MPKEKDSRLKRAGVTENELTMVDVLMGYDNGNYLNMKRQKR